MQKSTSDYGLAVDKAYAVILLYSKAGVFYLPYKKTLDFPYFKENASKKGRENTFGKYNNNHLLDMFQQAQNSSYEITNFKNAQCR